MTVLVSVVKQMMGDGVPIGAVACASTGDTSAYFRASSGPGWALIGDAGHFKDPQFLHRLLDYLCASEMVAANDYGTQARQMMRVTIKGSKPLAA